jgi:hypothetical protein
MHRIRTRRVSSRGLWALSPGGFGNSALYADLYNPQEAKPVDTVVYLLLGQDRLAKRLRPYFKVARRRSRHAAWKMLSALSLALCLLADPRCGTRADHRFVRILSCLANGRSTLLTVFSP